MQFSERWLRTFVDPPLDSGELARLLTMSGLEVEACEPAGPPFSGVVVGRIEAVEKHPDADRLVVCRVDTGTGGTLPIVCGAPNAAAGMKVPCAVVGAKLPGGEVKAMTMRGVESRGMLCSARELGLSNDHSGLLALPGDAPVGRDVRDVLALDDRVFTLKLTPNRADCLSVLGVAREVAALTGAKLAVPPVAAVPPASSAGFPVRISSSEGCGRFAARVIKAVNAAAPTPQWMKERLERAGQRPISALVDVTNYVMLELGQPLHVYDLAKLKGRIDVRSGKKGERLKLLNEQTVEVDGSVLCITDDTGPIGLAGIMGGDSTRADASTRDILLESAFFFPEAIAGRARRFNFASDASHRFERGVDFQGNVAAIERATRLILDTCGGEAGPVTDTVATLPERKPVRMRSARARKLIGVEVSTEEISGIFGRLGFGSRREGAGAEESFSVTPPSFRFDLQIEEDLIEEVARVYGFERIPAHPPVATALMRSRPETVRSTHALRHLLADCDYQEVVNFSFVDEAWERDFAGRADPLRVANPIASHLAVMRSTLIGGLVANVRYNLNRKLDRIRVFEIGRVYLRDPGAPDGPLEVRGVRQPARVAALAYGPALEEQWGAAARTVDFFDVKADLEMLLPRKARFESAAHPALHPGRSARVLVDGVPAGWIGELHPAWQQKYELPAVPVLFELDALPLLEIGLPRCSEVSKFPPIIRDRAVVVRDSVPVQSMLDALEAARPTAVQEIRVFDLYRGKGVEAGQKSLAFRVVMQDTARTLTDDEADAAMAQLTQVLTSRFDAKVRA